MSVFVRRIVAPFLFMLVLWLGLVLASLAIEELGGWSYVERAFPLNNVHLAEEAEEGIYAPLADPVFVVFQIFLAALIFGVGTYIAAVGADARQRPFATVPALAILALMVGNRIWAPYAPDAMKAAALVCMALYVLASIGGYAIASRRREMDV